MPKKPKKRIHKVHKKSQKKVTPKKKAAKPKKLTPIKNKSVKKQKVRKKRVIFPKKFLLKIFAGFLVIIVGFGIWVFWDIPLPNQLGETRSISTEIYDRNGLLLYEIYADERRSPIELSELPAHLIEATIAIEDKDFYEHFGFSIQGMSRALYKTVFRQQLEGGSTLTQQLVKNALLTPERTVRRKIREFALAILVEIRFSKDQILEMYLNQIPYGSTAYGIEAASELYFSKPAKELTLAESSLLAGLPAAPSRYSPFGSRPELAKQRQKTVLRRMVEDGYISQEEADAAFEEELTFVSQESLKAPHFSLWIKEQLAQKYGEAIVEQGGLRVTTTLDLELQEHAEEVVAEEIEKLSDRDVGNGAVLVTRPKTGEILAMVGSKDYFAQDEDGKVNIVFAKRQPGSSIKPLNYALGIRDGIITLATPIADVPTCFTTPGQEAYCPRNYDGQFHGAQQVRFSLGNSYNIPAVRVLAANGLENFITFARELGISTFTDPSSYGLSLTLGGGEVTMADMTVAYGVLANEGVKQPLVSILKVEDWSGKVLEEINPDDIEGDRILDPDVTFLISHALLDNNARVAAFGESSFLRVTGHPEVSVKTGTTNDLRDNWTIGYSKNAVVTSWVGNNDNSPMSGAVSGVSGASPIWNKVMTEVLSRAGEGFYSEEDVTNAWPRQPDNVVGASICANTGALPNDVTQDCPQRFEFFIQGTIPDNSAFRMDIPIDRELQQLADESTPPERIEMQNHLIVQDPLETIICLTCPFQMKESLISYPAEIKDKPLREN